MTLTSTLNIAQSSLATNAALSSVLSRNIAGVNDPNFSRKVGSTATTFDGGVSFLGVTNATDAALFSNLLSANSDAAASQAQADGLNQLEATVNLNATPSTSAGDTSQDNSAATGISTLAAALQTYAAAPADTGSAQAVLVAARALASGLNTASTTVQTVRAKADSDIASSVADINSLLQQYTTVNSAIISGTATGSDITDSLDARNKILSSLSQDIGINTVSAPNGGLSIYTDSGATLFQGTARSVTFATTGAYAAGVTGNAVLVDGVPVTGASAVMPVKGGKIAGLAQLRDVTAVDYQDQLDQIAGGLVTTFADSDQTGGGNPTVPGLFTTPGAPAMPTADQSGLAATISVNASVDPTQGGNIALLRDGGIGGGGNPAYTSNVTGATGYTGYITGLLSDLDATTTFDGASGGASQGTLAAYAQSSVSWLETSRQNATTAASDRQAVVSQTTTSLSNSTGVNLDDQLSTMLDLEHSYQASAQLITTVKSMYDALLSAVQ